MDRERIGLDTSVLIGYLRGGVPEAEAVEKAVQESDCYVTAITVYELWFGVTRSRKSIGEEALLGLMTVLPLNEGTAKRAASLHADLIRCNQDIGVKDVLIAAICMEHALPILTCNERHFSRVPGLTVITPTVFLSSSLTSNQLY